MKIAMISTPFLSVPPQNYGGTELVVYELVEGLVERGHDVTLFATGESQTGAHLRALFPRAQWPPRFTPTATMDILWPYRPIRRAEKFPSHTVASSIMASIRPDSCGPRIPPNTCASSDA